MAQVLGLFPKPTLFCPVFLVHCNTVRVVQSPLVKDEAAERPVKRSRKPLSDVDIINLL